MEKMWNKGTLMTGYKTIDHVEEGLAAAGKTYENLGVDPGDVFKVLTD